MSEDSSRYTIDKKAFDAFRLLEQSYISLDTKYNDIDKKAFDAFKKKKPANQIIEMLSQIILQNEKIQEKLEKANIENNKLKKMLKVMAKITLTESFYNDCDISNNDKYSLI
jgi:vacuolar-type H+-ATPase catalytic subunit A/Vma1